MTTKKTQNCMEKNKDSKIKLVKIFEATQNTAIQSKICNKFGKTYFQL